MRIAYILGGFPILSETFIGQEMRVLEEAGHEVFPIALHRPAATFQPQDQALAERTLYFSEIGQETAQRLLRRYFFRRVRAAAFIRAQTTEPRQALLVHAAHLAEYIKDIRCTQLHAHFGWGAATYAIAAAKLAKLPVTFTCHGSDVYTRPQDLALKCRTASAVIGVAPTITADLAEMAGHTPCHTIFCGVDTARFIPASEPLRRHARWLSVGRLIDCKGMEDVLAAWHLIPADERPMLDIVGDGPQKDALLAYVKAHGLEQCVSFLGAKTSEWIAAHAPYYRGFVAGFRQGSDGSRDTAPMTLKEVMAMALPIVTTSFIDIPALVGSECARLCPSGDSEALAAAVQDVHHLPQSVRDAMGMMGRNRVEAHYTVQRQADQLVALWSSLAHGRRT